MASPGINAKSYMQWGRETAGNWGVAVAATKRIGIDAVADLLWQWVHPEKSVAPA